MNNFDMALTVDMWKYLHEPGYTKFFVSFEHRSPKQPITGLEGKYLLCHKIQDCQTLKLIGPMSTSNPSSKIPNYCTK